MLAALLEWLEMEALFALLLELKPDSEPTSLPQARPPAIPDQVILKRLIPNEMYQAAMQLGWMGMHALSFALRHRITILQRLFHPLEEGAVDSDLRHALHADWERRSGLSTLPLFGFSPLGIHISTRPAGLCRAFDAFTLPHCQDQALGIFCAAHQTEAFWLEAAPGTQQAIMFRYYAELDHFAQYGEKDLESMLGAFWKRYRAYSSEDLGEALQYFGMKHANDLKQCGAQNLRRLFLELSLRHHPDRGGVQQDFVILQTHYQRLKHYLEARDLGS